MTASDASAPSIAVKPLQTGLARVFGGHVAAIGAHLEALADRERDQLPLWLPVGVGLGVAAWFWLPDQSAWTAFMLLAAAAALAPLALAPASRWSRALAVFCVAALLGCANIWWKAERVAAPRLAYAQLARFDATIDTAQRLPAKGIVRLVVSPSGPSRPPPGSASTSSRRRPALGSSPAPPSASARG